MVDWYVRVIRKDGSKGSEAKFANYVDAKIAFDKIDKLMEDQVDDTAGRIKLQDNNGTTFKMAYVA